MRQLKLVITIMAVTAMSVAVCMAMKKATVYEKPEKMENLVQVQPKEKTTEANEKEMVLVHSVNDSDYSGTDTAEYGWGLKKNKEAKPDVGKYGDIIKGYNAFYMDNAEGKKLYLTFDEGYENGCTAQILDTLRDKKVPAAFFITGPYLKTETELVRRMVEEGHDVGNHTVNHPNIATLSPSELADEVGKLNDDFYGMFGINMKYMRPPEGAFSQRSLKVLSDLGYKTVFWSFAYRDWERDKSQGADYAFSQITPYLHDGAVLLLHAVSADNAAALPDVIDYARSKGYEFGRLDEIIE